MEIKWLVEPRAVVVPATDDRDAYEVPADVADHRGVVDLPVDVARDLIGQGVAEMANKPKPARKATAATKAASPAAAEPAAETARGATDEEDS